MIHYWSSEWAAGITTAGQEGIDHYTNVIMIIPSHYLAATVKLLQLGITKDKL